MLFNEPKLLKSLFSVQSRGERVRFSALQRAEIAEIAAPLRIYNPIRVCFSALQRAEIAEIFEARVERLEQRVFQCSSTSRNC